MATKQREERTKMKYFMIVLYSSIDIPNLSLLPVSIMLTEHVFNSVLAFVLVASIPETTIGFGSREGQFPRWKFAVRVRSEGSAVKAPQ